MFQMSLSTEDITYDFDPRMRVAVKSFYTALQIRNEKDARSSRFNWRYNNRILSSGVLEHIEEHCGLELALSIC